MRSAGIYLMAFILAGCATAPESTKAPGLSGRQKLVSNRMAFGQSMPGGRVLTRGEWEEFMREVVSPHFPEGLTVWRGEGQWTGALGPVKEPVMVVEVIHPPGRPAEAVFEKIMAEYCRRFRQEAVLRTTSPVRSHLFLSQSL